MMHEDSKADPASGDESPLHFYVTLPSGESYDVAALPTDLVHALREGVEKQHEIPPACLLKIFQGGQLLMDTIPVAQLDPAEPVWAVIATETKLEVLLQAAGSFEGYAELLRNASEDPLDKNVMVVGPMPPILQVLEEMAGEPKGMENLRPGEEGSTLEFFGDNGDLLLPSLDATPLLIAAGIEKFARVTVCVEVNSDAYNQGLGVVLEASPMMESTVDQKGLPYYVCLQPAWGVKVWNAVKFHPGMGGGQLRVEGAGGWGNHSIGFTPESWANSGNKFHRLELTLGTDGQNEMCIKGTNEGEEWRKPWTRQLTGGRHLPAIYAWLDLGSKGRPLHIGSISMRVHMQ